MKPNKHLRLLLSGLAAGDCLGVTSEFLHQESVKEVYEKYKSQGWPFICVGREKFDLKPGEHTDDTDMAWDIIKSFIEKEKFDPNDIAQKFVEWYNTMPKDIGHHTRLVLDRIANGYDWQESSNIVYFRNPKSLANGSLMRNGIICGLTEDWHEALEYTIVQSIITHYAPLPVICCAAQTWLIHAMLFENYKIEDYTKIWPTIFAREFFSFLENYGAIGNSIIFKWAEDVGINTIDAAMDVFSSANFDPDSFNPFVQDLNGVGGYCLITLQIAVWALHWSVKKYDFAGPGHFPPDIFKRRGNDVLSWIPLIGFDADTYAATAGPMLVARHGDLPKSVTSNLQVLYWLDKLDIS